MAENAQKPGFFKKIADSLYDWLMRDPYDIIASFRISEIYIMVKETKLRTLKNLLVEGKIDVNSSILQGVGHTLIQEAIIFNKYEIFKLCLLMNANLNVKDETGTSPLFSAIYLHRNLMVEEMLRNKHLDLRIKDGANRNLLQAAEFYENYESYKLLQEIFKEKGVKLEEN